MTLTADLAGGPLTMTYETWVSPPVVEPGALPVDGVDVDVYQVDLIRGERAPEPPPCAPTGVPKQSTNLDSTYALQRVTPPTAGDFTTEVTIAPITGTEVQQQMFFCAPGSYDHYTWTHREVTIPQTTLAAMQPGCYQFLGSNSVLAETVTGSLATLEIGAGACSTG